MSDPNLTLDALVEFINRKADKEVALMWENQFEPIVQKLSNEMFRGQCAWYLETKKAFFGYRTELQRREVASRIVDTASLSVKQKEG